MKAILIGSVSSSRIMLEEMIKCNFPIAYVFGLDENRAECVSGYESLCDLADRYNIPSKSFININDSRNYDIICKEQPDYIFVIGLSQIIKKELINIAKIAVVGCHPAPLPKYRGRAVVVWQMLMGESESQCTLFKIDEGMDSGPIIGKETYLIGKDDYAIDVQNNINAAFHKLCARVLKEMKDGKVTLTEQDESKATYCLVRREEDGQICWNDSADKIQCLIRAISEPYPGAFSFYEGKHKVFFDKARVIKGDQYMGLSGQIVQKTNEYIDILTSDGILRVEKYRNTNEECRLLVGHKFKEIVL
ncbi:MAG: methionyl-tRNA formyltransferase [Lachnospiraceae bacterium]|nr:methionyl-tRNA formyltransferase [Lachnospiraceae bacterium]